MAGFPEDQMRAVRWELWISQEVQGNHGSSLQQLASPDPDLLLQPEDPFGPFLDVQKLRIPDKQNQSTGVTP